MLTPKTRNAVSGTPATSVAQSQATPCGLQRKHLKGQMLRVKTLDTFPLNSEWRLLDMAPQPNIFPSFCFLVQPTGLHSIWARGRGKHEGGQLNLADVSVIRFVWPDPHSQMVRSGEVRLGWAKDLIWQGGSQYSSEYFHSREKPTVPKTSASLVSPGKGVCWLLSHILFSASGVDMWQQWRRSGDRSSM